MVKNTKDNQIIPFLLQLKVEKWKDFDLKDDNLADTLFCDKKLDENFKKIGFEFEKQPSMQFDVKCDNQTQNTKKIGSYYFDILNTKYEDDYNILSIQLYFEISENTDNISQKLEESVKEIVTENLFKKYLLFSYDDQSRPSGPIYIRKVMIEKIAKEKT